MYYLQSRYYDPEIGRFINGDAFAATGQGMLGNNMFAYCLNNPVSMADSDGQDAIYVVDYKLNRGLPIAGHSILYFQDEDGNWYKTQYAGQFPFPSTAYIELYAAPENEIMPMIKGESIDDIEYIYIEGDFSACHDYAEGYKGTNYGGYDLFTNNCHHYAKNTLCQGEFADSNLGTLARSSDTIVPSNYGRWLQIASSFCNAFNDAQSSRNKYNKLVWRYEIK